MYLYHKYIIYYISFGFMTSIIFGISIDYIFDNLIGGTLGEVVGEIVGEIINLIVGIVLGIEIFEFKLKAKV